MKAIVVPIYGDVEVLQYRDVPIPAIEAIFPLYEARKAHELLQSRHVCGKIVLDNLNSQ